MNKRYVLSDSYEINKRKKLAKQFYQLFLKDETPIIVTDACTLYDFYFDDEHKLIKKMKSTYGIELSVDYFNIPFWKLLDYIEKNKKNKFNY